MKKKNNVNKAIYKSFTFIIFVFLGSCNNYNVHKNQVETKLNDSLDIKIFFNDNGKTIRTLIIRNNLSKINNIYGFHEDGITISILGQEKDGLKIGPYYTYYSDGKLNNKINYREGKLDGEYISYSESGKVIYKAYYEGGIKIKEEIKDTTTNIEIIEINK